jgi:hypothetical protein
LHPITLVVRDVGGLEGIRTCTASVVDTTPPDLSATLVPASLWPPNHRMVDIAVTVQASDVCGAATFELSAVTSDEPDDAAGPDDGETTQDIQGVDAGTADVDFSLRAERYRNGPGRSYTVEVRALDASGNSVTRLPTVVVPHDVAGVAEPILLTASETPAGTLLEWTAVAGAVGYDVIRGEQPNITDIGNAFDLGPVLCIEARSTDGTTGGDEDPSIPQVGRPLFYLVQSLDAAGFAAGYGTETAAKPRVLSLADGCP